MHDQKDWKHEYKDSMQGEGELSLERQASFEEH